MALQEDVIFTDPVLHKIFFDERRFAPRSTQVAAVNCLLARITDDKVPFLKCKRLSELEPLQIRMRQTWFKVRRLCDGYALTLPAGHDDGCEHVQVFAHDNLDPSFSVDARARYALWMRYEKRPPLVGLHRFTERI